LCAIMAVRAFDGSKSTRSRARYETRLSLIAIVLGFGTCVFVSIFFGTTHVVLALGVGLATFLALVVSRRFALNSWGIAGVISVMLLLGTSIAGTLPRIYSSHPTLSFADAPKSLISATERMLADGNWTGSGAGSFKAILPIYKDADGL